jgi:hypothetical protein
MQFEDPKMHHDRSSAMLLLPIDKLKHHRIIPSEILRFIFVLIL